MLAKAYQGLVNENRRLIRELVAIKARMEEVLGVGRIRRRRTYGKKATREHGDRGRIVRECAICKKHRVIHGRKMCRKCYMKWYYRNRVRKERLGGKPLTTKEWRDIQDRREKEWREKQAEKPLFKDVVNKVE